MWYLTWMLGTAMACGVAVAVGLWYELHRERLDGSQKAVGAASGSAAVATSATSVTSATRAASQASVISSAAGERKA